MKAKHVNIIDDDISVCRALKCLLATYGFAVDIFHSSEKFFKSVPQTDKGCLIMDIHMPGMDGWKILEQMINTGYRCPVILISADKNSGLRERALDSGAVGFFQKPFKGQELVDLIDLVC